jgi:uncharacterized membrane protein (GlpM family)
MLQTVIKVVITSLVVVAIAEAAKRSTWLAAILASLPLTSMLAFVWLYAETGDTGKIAALSTGIFWLVLPSLVLFLALPLLLRANVSFIPALAIAIMLTAASYGAMLAILARLGIEI